MAKLNAQQVAEKWGRRLKASGEDMRIGVNNVTEAPGIAAARAQDKMLANTTEAITSGRWANAVRAVPLEQWKNALITKGIPRISAGVDGAMQAQVQMYEKLLAAVDSVASKVRAMPNVTLEDSIQRMTAFARGMAERRLK